MLPFTRPILDANACIDFYAGNEHAFNLVKPVYDALPPNRKGIMYHGEFGNSIPGNTPLVITNPKDLMTVFYLGEERPFILLEFEHHTDTFGLLPCVSLFLAKEQRTVQLRKSFITDDKFQQAALVGSVQSMVDAIVKYVVGIEPKHITRCNGDTVGIIYMAFGDKAATAVKRSVATLKRIGYSYPVVVVGDRPVDGFQFIQWDGVPPFDYTEKKNFQFRAGRIKPFLYEKSPFDRTLYIDADTEFIQDIYAGFEMLDRNEMAITKEYLTVGELYNKKLAGWEINLEERDYTIKQGISPKENFINSGVIFFKACFNCQQVFDGWYREWNKFKQWDEQLALMRSINLSTVKVTRLEPCWNDPSPKKDTIIFHNYGRGVVRS